MISMELSAKSRKRALRRAVLCEQAARRIMDHLVCEIDDLDYTLARYDLEYSFSSVIERRLDRRELYRQWHKMARLMQTARDISTALRLPADYLTVTHDQGRFLADSLSREPDGVAPWLLEQLNSL